MPVTVRDLIHALGRYEKSAEVFMSPDGTIHIEGRAIPATPLYFYPGDGPGDDMWVPIILPPKP